MIGERPLKTSIVKKLNADFNHNRIPGLVAIPTVIQDRPVAGLPEPYIYVEIAPGSVREVDVTKSGSSFEYQVNVQVMTKSQTNSDSKGTRDLIVSEIQNVIDTDNGGGYLDLSSEGYNVYVQNVIRVQPGETYGVGADYFFSTLVLAIRMEFVGQTTQSQPSATLSFTYDGFDYDPSNGKFELYDSGTITGASSYLSSNGWDNTSAAYSLVDGSDGSIEGAVVTVDSGDDDLDITGILQWELASDSTITTSTTSTVEFDAEKSLRIGSGTPSTVSAASLRGFTGWTIIRGTTDPDGAEITITANENEYLYIVVGSDVTITELTDSVGTENIDNFSSSIVDEYRVYISNNPIYYDNSIFNYTITTS